VTANTVTVALIGLVVLVLALLAAALRSAARASVRMWEVLEMLPIGTGDWRATVANPDGTVTIYQGTGTVWYQLPSWVSADPRLAAMLHAEWKRARDNRPAPRPHE
jgi:hypothetical protein